MTAASPKGVPRSDSPTRNPEDPDILGHHLAFSVVRHRVEIADEILRKEPSSEADGYLLYRTPDGTLMRRMLMSAHSWIPGGDVPEAGDIPPLSSDQSILSQYRAYITLGIGGVYSGIQTFREWTFGRYTHLRQPQPGRDRRLREVATQHDASPSGPRTAPRLAPGIPARRSLAHGRDRRQPVSSIGIYMEGGGPTKSSGRAALRQGMERFLAALKQRAREASWHWKLAC